MSDLNQCNFIGRLGKDPEVRYMKDGKAVASFSIAVGKKWKNQAGQKLEATEWVRITAFGNLAEICKQYLRKGGRIFISGEIKTTKWQDQSGNDRYSTEIIARQMQMLDSAEQSNQEQGYQQDGNNQQQGQDPRQSFQAPQQTQQQNQSTDHFNDDIPF
jgi:single-strand DNA-binding protein